MVTPRAKPIGKPLKKIPPLGTHGKKPPQPTTQRAKVDVRARVAPNYAKVKGQVLGAIANLPGEDKAKIAPTFTLPEMMVALALIWLGWHFDAQASESGGRLYLGGSVVDFKVYLGTGFVCVRVQGDYWHALPDRVQKDAVQWTRLHALGYRVSDIWEHTLMEAWVANTLKQTVEQAIINAA